MGVASLVVRSLPHYDPGGHGLPTEAPPQRIVTIALSFAAPAFRPEAGVGGGGADHLAGVRWDQPAF
jgi:hypothetical protein